MSGEIAKRGDVVTAISPSVDEQRRLMKQLLSSEKLTDAEFELFAEVCRRTNMDPFRRQIYAIKRKSKDKDGNWVDKMVIQFGIDGMRAQARRDGLAGIDDAVFTWAEEPQRPATDDEKALEKWYSQCRSVKKFPVSATVTVYRWAPNGQKESYTATARLREYMQTYKDGNPSGKWADMPCQMLAKCAEAAALRKGFAESVGGMHTAEEFEHEHSPNAMTKSGRAKQLDDVIARRQRIEETQHDAITGEVIDEPPQGEGYYPGDADAP